MKIVEQKILNPEARKSFDPVERQKGAVTIRIDLDELDLTPKERNRILKYNRTIDEICKERLAIANLVDANNKASSIMFSGELESAKKLHTTLVKVLGENYVYGMLEQRQVDR